MAKSIEQANQIIALAESTESQMLATLIIPLLFQVFMSVGMNRVWSFYLML